MIQEVINDNQEEKVVFEPEEAPRKHPFKKFFNKIYYKYRINE